MTNRNLEKCFSPKQLEVLKDYKYRRPRFLINHGAVRTGKTTIDNFIFLRELLRIHEYAEKRGIRSPQYILGGASINKIQENVIRELENNYNLEIKLNRFNEFRLFDVVVCCKGTDDIGDFKNMVGITSFGAYVNEGSVCHPDIFDEIDKRCSGDYDISTGLGYSPMIIVDSNPDHPEHYLKKDYIDKADGRHIISRHWELDDNVFLNPEYVENLKSTTPSGMYYDRKIRGLWVSAEGAVYGEFDKSVHVTRTLPSMRRFVRYFCGVDWGYEHKGSICLFGVLDDGDVYLLKEITSAHRLIDWWVEQAQNIIREFGYGIKFWCDSARPDNINEFRKANVWAVEADKSVAAGIEKVAYLLHNGKLHIYAGGTEWFLKEVYSYVWNPKTGEPIKQNDDVMDATRYGIYNDALEHGY